MPTGAFCVLLLAGLVAVLAVVGVWWAWRKNRSLRETMARTRQVEQTLRNILQASPDVIFVLGADGRYHEIYTCQPELLADAEQRLLGRTIHEMLPAEVASTCQCVIDRAIATGRPQSHQYHLDLPDGRRWFSAGVSAFEHSPETQRVLWVARDVTEQKQTSEALRQSELRLRTLYEGIRDAVFVHEVFADGRVGPFLEVNDVACRRLGYTRREMMVMTPVDIDAPESTTDVPGIAKRMFAGEGVVFEQIHLTKDGCRIPVEICGTVLQLDGRSCVMSIARDIGERKEQQEALRQRDAILSAVGLAAKRFLHGAWQDRIEEVLAEFREAIHADRVALYQRDAAGDHIGRRRCEARAADLAERDLSVLEEITMPEEHPWLNNLQRNELFSFRARDLTGFEADLLGPTGIRSGLCIPVFASNHWWGALCFEDFQAERDWAEPVVAALRIGAELLGAAIQHEAIMEQLLTARKLESIGILAGGIAHDFNNVLTAILGNISLCLQQAALPEDSQASLHEARNACREACDLVRHLMAFARGGGPHRQPESVDELLRDVVAQPRTNPGIRIHYAPSETLPLVAMDRKQIRQVLDHLVRNACDAMPDGGEIVLGAETVSTADFTGPPARRFVRVWVCDTGPGIPEEMRHRLFDPFFTTKHEGSGLGLAAAHTILRRHDGVMRLCPSSGGACVEFFLPLVNGAVPTKPAAAVSDQRPTALSLRVLIMDDQEIVRSILQRMVTGLGHQADTAEEGRNAIALYRAGLEADQPYDLVILDLVVPEGMGGLETAGRIRALDPKARLVVCSGYSDNLVMEQYEEHGFRAAIRKPFELEELRALLEKVSLGTPT